MTHSAPTPARLRLTSALDGLATTFRGMTAHPDEYNCDCHWGSSEELALLKRPDAELGPDLLRRTWEAGDWEDHGSVLRRILPQLASELVGGRVEPHFGMGDVGRSIARGQWRRWPAEQAGAVAEFLHAWWAHSLTAPDAAVPAHGALVLCSEASGGIGPWLAVWEATPDPLAGQRLAEAVDHWEYDLLGDQLPWSAWDDAEETRAELVAWLTGHAAARLRAHGAPEHLLHRIRLLGLTWSARWQDPHAPDHRY